MAHDPRQEDNQRLGLRYARELERNGSASALRSFSQFGRRFAQDRDSLPQTDADRAFHLVVLATEAIDYRLPFANETQAEALIKRGRELLDEALALDPDCFDALRMQSSSQIQTIEGRWRFLVEREPEVRAHCEEARKEALANGSGDERDGLAANIAMRPWWRWLASMAEEALICGRNHESIELARRLIESDPLDMSDARFTLAYAYAKLEDEKALDDLSARYPSNGRGNNDAWLLIARLALAHKRFDLDGARDQLRRILRAYPDGAVALIRQTELPDGEFARLHVRLNSEDELILALSEGVVLLQEGDDREGRGVLGKWVAREVSAMNPSAAMEAASFAMLEGAH